MSTAAPVDAPRHRERHTDDTDPFAAARRPDHADAPVIGAASSTSTSTVPIRELVTASPTGRTAMSTTIAQQWHRAAALVAAADVDFTTSSTQQIRQWARTVGADSPRLWRKVKRELFKQHGIDYERRRLDEGDAARYEVAAAAASGGAPAVELFTAGDPSGTFAVTAGTLDTAWFGRFPRRDLIYRAGDPLAAQMSAAGKALFLAGQVRRALDADVVRLTLWTTADDLDHEKLTSLAATHHRILLAGVGVREDNPAAAMCMLPGHRAWQEIALPDLITDDSADRTADNAAEADR